MAKKKHLKAPKAPAAPDGTLIKQLLASFAKARRTDEHGNEYWSAREYCEILPRLAPGVLVHIHDISLPKPYFQLYFQNHLYWNEQYLLQAFLSLNKDFEILCALYALARRRPDKLRELIPSWRDGAVPGAFWIRRV